MELRFDQVTMRAEANLANKEQFVVKTFSDRNSYHVAGFFQHDPFWNRFVLQLSHTEPAIFNALSAINMALAQVE